MVEGQGAEGRRGGQEVEDLLADRYSVSSWRFSHELRQKNKEHVTKYRKV